MEDYRKLPGDMRAELIDGEMIFLEAPAFIHQELVTEILFEIRAYIRKNNQFQVWMVEADFYDLSLDKDNWTYSNLWNLRYGRLISYNEIKDDNKVMNLVKILLNTSYTTVKEDIKGEILSELKLDVENNNSVTLIFYKTDDNKYFVKYDFLKLPNGKHIEFFEKYVRGKYLEISEATWEKIKDGIAGEL